MWNPFKSVRLQPQIVEDVPSAPLGDGAISDEITKAQLKSMAERTKILMIYDQLTSDALLLRNRYSNVPNH